MGLERKPRPEIGEYWVSKGGSANIVCKGYVDPPSAQRFLLGPACRFEKNSSFGPVHEVESFREFVSIRVPHPQADNVLVWVNLSHFGRNFAHRVPPAVVESWRNNGWRDKWVYIPETFLSTAVAGAIVNSMNPAG